MAEIKGYLKDKDNNTLYLSNLLDFFYPIGTYYETTNTSFNPNITFGGTWIQEETKEIVASCYYYFGSFKYNDNIKSITRTGDSTWKVTFTNALKDYNYVPLLSAERSGFGTEITGVYSKGADGFTFDMINYDGGTYKDNDMEVNLLVYGQLANPIKKRWKRTK